MRDMFLDDIVFESASGKSYTIKDMREYPEYVFWKRIKINSGDDLDEIASRNTVYGQDGELLFYTIFEFNRVALFDLQFDTTLLRTIDIPVA